jgi:putative ABC transport system permease protein
VPLAVVAVIAAFMLLMVAFGLFGVLWQNTTRRIPEIGLRRALGASAAGIYRQIVFEQLLLCSLAVVVGLVLLVQLPLTGALGEALNWSVFAGACALSMAVIYLLSFVCSLYPGWRASRLDPAAALHYE